MSTRRAMPLITVRDLDAAIEAYRRLTGMEVVMNHGWIATLSPPGDRSIQISLIASDPTAPVNPAVSIEGMIWMTPTGSLGRTAGRLCMTSPWRSGECAVSSFGMRTETS